MAPLEEVRQLRAACLPITKLRTAPTRLGIALAGRPIRALHTCLGRPSGWRAVSQHGAARVMRTWGGQCARHRLSAGRRTVSRAHPQCQDESGLMGGLCFRWRAKLSVVCGAILWLILAVSSGRAWSWPLVRAPTPSDSCSARP